MEKRNSILLKGFKIGMLLQIAVGPVCLFIFHAAIEWGFGAAVGGVFGAAAVDAMFIIAAFFGMGTLIEKRPALRRWLKFAGAAVLVLFGINLIAGAFSCGFLPEIDIGDAGAAEGVFLRSAAITLSNPLTIIFWAGVFAQRMAEEALHRRDMAVYGIGAVLSTIVSLALVAALGGITNMFISADAIRVLNALVGLVLIVFGIRTALKK